MPRDERSPFGRLPVLLSGFVAFGLVYLGWAIATQAWNAWALFIIYGVYAGMLVAAGREFSYPIFGPWARRRMKGRLG